MTEVNNSGSGKRFDLAKIGPPIQTALATVGPAVQGAAKYAGKADAVIDRWIPGAFEAPAAPTKQERAVSAAIAAAYGLVTYTTWMPWIGLVGDLAAAGTGKLVKTWGENNGNPAVANQGALLMQTGLVASGFGAAGCFIPGVGLFNYLVYGRSAVKNVKVAISSSDS